MPELPEVQTVVSDLNKKVIGMRIADFWTEHPKAIKYDLVEFKQQIIGTRIVAVNRRAKNILISLDNGFVILVHLKMTGHLLFKKTDEKKEYFRERVNGYIRHSWSLEDDRGESVKLDFSDLRKFGKVMLFEAEGHLHHPELAHFGVEPLSSEFTLEKFKEILVKYPNRMIRVLLLDQDVIAGLGNIYVSEVLFEAGVDPKRRAGSLMESEIGLIHKYIIEILEKAIEMRGTSDSDYRDTAGAPGGFQNFLKVYNREGKTCQRDGCQGIVEREKIAQRSSYWCPQCQK